MGIFVPTQQTLHAYTSKMHSRAGRLILASTVIQGGTKLHSWVQEAAMESKFNGFFVPNVVNPAYKILYERIYRYTLVQLYETIAWLQLFVNCTSQSVSY